MWEAATLAVERSNAPALTGLEILLQRLDAMERKNVSLFENLKERIFWTPLLWAAIGLALWVFAYMLTQSA